MFLIYGIRSTGRIYTATNKLVSTVFFHIFFIPIIPVKSVLVENRGYILDKGEPIPFNVKSIITGYLRNAAFALLLLGIVMLFNGLFLNSVVEKDELITIGTYIFLTASLLWLWAMYVLGSKREPNTLFGFPSGRLLLGTVLICAVLVVMFGVAERLPQEITYESIASDPTLTDERVIERLAQKAFPENAQIKTFNNSGVELSISYSLAQQTQVPTRYHHLEIDTAQVSKASIILPIFLGVKDIISYGRSRNLTKISVSHKTTFIQDDGSPHEIENYRITIPENKFNDILKIEVNREVFLSLDVMLKELGVVEVDN